MKIVKVDWVDSYTEHGWKYKEDVKIEPAKCQSVGYLIQKNNKYVTLAQSDSDDVCDGLVSIPRGCIVSMQELK